MRARIALWLMVVCLLVAAALRLPDLIDSPPGLHYDEAANATLAADIGLRGQRPIFIASYTGKETLFFYLAGGAMRIIGESLFTLRLTSAFIGLLTVAATYWLVVELLADRRVALAAAALLAITFWHVMFSRLGFRAISQPLLQALAVAALFRGLGRDPGSRSWPWLAFAGIFLGLTAYSYLAARIFPIPLALALLPLLAGKQHRRRRWQQIALFVAVALIVATPLLVYFFSHPDAFFVRIDQVLPADRSLATYLDGYLKSLGMFFLVGDPYWRFNVPGRPLFDWFWGGLLVVGWLLTTLRLTRPLSQQLRSACLLLSLVPLFMLLPTALALDEIVPSNLRAIGLLPFIMVLPATGLWALIDSLQKSLGRLGQRLAVKERLSARWDSRSTVLAAAVLIVLVAGGLMTARTYFSEWRYRTDLYYESDADLVAVAHYLDTLETADSTLYLTALHYRHPTIAFLSDRYDQVKWLPQSRALVFPAGGSATLIYSHNSPAPEWVRPYLPDEPATVGPDGPDSRPTFIAYRLDGRSGLDLSGEYGPTTVTNANFSGRVTLLGYDVGAAAETAGLTRSLPLTLFWRVEQPPDAGYVPFVHLEDTWNYRWSQVESDAYPAEQWSPGDVVIHRVDVPLPPGIPPGNYRLRAGFFDPASGDQLARLDEAGRYAGSELPIDGVWVGAAPPPEPTPHPPVALNMPAGPGLTLVGYERGAEQVTAGSPLWLSFWWLADAPLDPRLIRLELFEADRTGSILMDALPVHGTYPFENWATPQFVIDHHGPKVPADTPAGDYRLNLRLMDAGDNTIITVNLGLLTVEAADRLFTPPKTQYPLAATFGEVIRLLGYDLEEVEPDRYALDLVWQAATTPAESYTVFVHVLGLDGVCCLWQADAPPMGGTRPTDLWLPDEVVVDDYIIELPPGTPSGSYPLEIGLYLPDNGQRLLVTMPGLRDGDALYLRPLVVE